MDTYTERTTTSYGQNIMNSFKGILFGLILLVGSIVLLWWNEGRSVDQADALKEMREKTIVLPSSKYYAENNNNPVWVHGDVKPIQALEDKLFDIHSNDLILKRNVSMFQWKEDKESSEEKKLGGSTETVTTYSYSKGWASTNINSTSFKIQEGHQNPQMLHQSQTFSTDANLGDFYLSKGIVSHINASEPYDLSSVETNSSSAENYQEFLYIGKDPQNPDIGDMRITYSKAPAGDYSICAEQTGEKLTPYTAQNANKLLFIRYGNVSYQEIFQQELDANSFMTWILRGVGLLLMFIGFMLLMGPLETLGNVIPMIGSIVGGASALIAFILTIVLGFIVILLAWFGARPILLLGVIGVSIALIFGIGKFGKRQGRATPPPRNK